MGLVSLSVSCFVAIGIAWLVTPLIMNLAERVGAIDQPNERKIHIRPIPRLGGVAVFIAFLLALGVQTIAQTELSSSWITQREGVAFFIALLGIFLLGIWDDIRSLKPFEKFLVQIVLGSLAYIAGFRISEIQSPLIDFARAGIIDYVLTILWIVGITNAVNLIDGLDGLASGISILSAMTLFAVSLINQDSATAMVALVLAGSLIGFLRYNFNPAKIFLGDSGSLFVGFALALLSIRSSVGASSTTALAVPLLALGVPIIDTTLAMVRRFLRSFLPKQQVSDSFLGTLKSIFLPDRSHVHHRLIARGFSHARAVLLLYLIGFLFGIGAIAVRVSNEHDGLLVLLVLFLVLTLGIGQLRYREMAILRNGILLRLYMYLYNWRMLRRTTFQFVVDSVFVAVSFAVAYSLGEGLGVSAGPRSQFWFSLGLVSCVQLAVFWLSGLYRGTIHQAGVGDALRNAKSVVLATIVAASSVGIMTNIEPSFTAALFVMDFFLVLSFVVASRFSFAALRYLFEKEHSGEKRILIYGADSDGVLILQNMLGFDSHNLTPIGFIDDDPVLEGKFLNGYPILGGHLKLERLLVRFSVNEIILAKNIKPEVFRRLKSIARTRGIVIRRFQIRLEDVTREAPRTQKDQSTVSVDITR